MLFNILQTGIDSTLAAAAENSAAQVLPQQQEMSYSLIQMAVKGGWLMLVLLHLLQRCHPAPEH